MRARLRWGGALVAVAAVMAALSLPVGVARADTTSPGYDQMSGVGPTASAKTVDWTAGILDSSNNPITSATTDRIASTPTSPESFMYSDFKNLQVKVSQTEDLGHQGITVSWSGGVPTTQTGTAQANFLQMMECWGDASTGPTPEQCEFGSPNVLAAGAINPVIGARTGDLCLPGSVANTDPTKTPSSLNGDAATEGCDPNEPANNGDDLAPCPASGPSPSPSASPSPSPTSTDDTTACPTQCPPTGPATVPCDSTFTIPFEPVGDPTALDWNTSDTTYYNEFDTNEVQQALTAADGTGQQQFETLTGVQASGLGCGQAESDGSARGCWLVIVPRGVYEPNGWKVNPNTANGLASYLDSSPLSASNWAQRIQIHLGFSPVGSFCPPGTLERQTFGTQMIARAMQSWQIALNQAAKCSRIYGYSATFEQESTQNLQAGGDSGLAFTVIPIGSEAARDGLSPPTNLPNIVYAPVAITASDFGFNINDGAGYATTPVKLNPLLVAKALTQSYKQDLPDFIPTDNVNGPSWAQNNPVNISVDPDFQNLNSANPQVLGHFSGPVDPLLTEDHSAVNQKVWQWVQGDSAATKWLGGTAEASDNNMAVDPDYSSLNLATATVDSYPRNYNGTLSLCELAPAGSTPSPTPSPTDSGSPSPSPSPSCPAGQVVEVKRSLDLLPYAENFDQAAALVVAGDNTAYSGNWNPSKESPSSTPGYWDQYGVEPPGQVFMWAANDTADLAAYGLVPAQLCDQTNPNCISPTVDTVGAAVAAAKPDSSGLLQVDPATAPAGAYPLTEIIYAAVPTNQSAAALTDYANLISYAVVQGQVAGTAVGDLPPGYLPLTPTLVSQAQAVVTQLQTLATASPSPSTSSTQASSSSSSSSSSSDQSQNTDTGSTTPAAGNAGTSTSSSTGPAGTGATTGNTPAPSPEPAGNTSPAGSSVSHPASSVTSSPAAKNSSSAAAVGGATTPGGTSSSIAAQPAAGTTPQQAVGAIRWVLIGVAVIGAGFAGSGTLLSSGGLPPWRRRRLL